MMADSTHADRRLACIGLSFHELETTRLVVGLLSHRLTHRWRWSSPDDADAIVVDPRQLGDDSDNFNISARAAVITLLEHDDTEPVTSSRAIYRPFRPRSLIQALNYADDASTGVASAKSPDRSSAEPQSAADIVWQEKTLLDAFIDTTRAPELGHVTRIAGYMDDDIVIDPERDAIRGPVDRLNMADLAGERTFDIASVPRAQVEAASDGDERQLCTFLLAMAENDDDTRCLFGDIYRTKVRLDGWPDLSSLQIDRGHIKAVTLVRHAPYTVAAAAAFAGANPARLLPLFNATYLNGNLTVEATGDTEAEQQAPKRKHSANILSRIRTQIGIG